MYISQASTRPLTKRWLSSLFPTRNIASFFGPRIRGCTEESSQEFNSATAYCVDLLKKYDSPSYTLLPFIPATAQTAYLAIRAFNVEVARIADTVSTPEIGALRLQFWRDNISRAFEGTPPRQPISVLLASALEELSLRTNRDAKLSKSWFMRVISTREQYLNNVPYVTMDALDQYAENTYSTLMYLTLQSIPLSSITADHVASHIGKAAGIVAVLRGLPLLAFPAAPRHHFNLTGLNTTAQQQRRTSQQGVVTLPLDVMAEVGLREEDVLRKGANAEGLRDAVFKVATRASDHIITARSMLKNLQRGEDVGHPFEHDGKEGHQYTQGSAPAGVEEQRTDIEQGFGIMMPAVSTSLWLDRLQKLDFDIFQEELRRREWKLPWKAYLAYNRRFF